MTAIYKQIGVFLAVILTILPIAFAEELIFDGWVDHEEKFFAEGKEYVFFAVSKDLLSAKLHAGRYGTLFFNKGESQESGPIRVEYEDSREKTGANDPDPRRNAEYHVKLLKKQANIEFWRETDKEYPLYLDRFNIIVYVENEADEPIKPVYVTQELPEGLKKIGEVLLTKITGEKQSTASWDASLDNDKAIKWNGVIKEDERIKLTQKVEVLHKQTNAPIIIPEAVVDYTYKSLSYNKTVEKKEINLGDPLSIIISKNKEEIVYGDKVRYTIQLINKHSEQELKITKLAFILENTTKLYSKDNDIKQPDKKNEQYFIWSGRIAPGMTKEVRMDLNLYGSSGKTITLVSEHGYKDLQLTKQISDEVEIDIAELDTYITADKITYTSGENATFKFFMENMNANIPFQNIKIKLTSELFPIERMLLSITSRQNELIKEMKLQMPEVDKTTIKTMMMSGTYETASHVPFEFSVTKAITIIPREESEKPPSPVTTEENSEGYIDEEGSIPEEAFVQPVQPGEGVPEPTAEVAAEELKAEEAASLAETITKKEEHPGNKTWLVVLAIIIIALLIGGSASYYILEKKKAVKKAKEVVKDIKEEIEDEVQKVLRKIT